MEQSQSPSPVLFIILIVLITLSMLFSIAESSFLGMNKLRLRVLRKNRDKKALKAGRLMDKKEKLINTLLVSNEIVNILVSSIITSIALSLFGQKGVGIATLVATVLLLIFGEITPKSISTRCPDKIAYGLSGFISIIYFIMHPIVVVITFISNLILRLFGIKVDAKKQSYTEEEIKTFFDMSSESGIIEEDENRMMTQVFKFGDLEAQDIMVPRTKIRAVSQDATYRDVIELSQRLGFTRFPVYRKSIDDIIGVIYLKDMLPYKNHQQDFNIQKVMRPPLFILGTKKMSSVQELLFQNNQSMAVIVDEYSGTDGILTEKDISREIFSLPGDNTLRGKVFDFDAVEDKKDFEINGSVLIRDLREDLHIDLKSSVNETIGGWFTEQIDRMPEKNDLVEFSGWLFRVVKIQSHRIERLRISKTGEGENDL
ncbi:MAG: HlyC/CorC family transporter [Treponema sp.]|nr:HlyC/CorC family transporter [Treponema sp.]